jgi:hypothetical protein
VDFVILIMLGGRIAARFFVAIPRFQQYNSREFEAGEDLP